MDNHQVMATSGGQGYTERNDAIAAAGRVGEVFNDAVIEFEMEPVEDEDG